MLLTGSYIHFPTHHFGESSRLVFGGSKKTEAANYIQTSPVRHEAYLAASGAKGGEGELLVK